MTKLVDDIENSFDTVSRKIESYRSWLEGSISHFETDKYLEDLIKSQRLLKKLSAEVNKSLDGLINEYY